jgi:hypothetical protein
MPAIDSYFRDLHATEGLPAIKLRAFSDFVLRILSVLDSSVTSFWGCADALTELATSRAALEYVETELLTSLRSPHYLPQLKLLECDRFTLFLRYVSPKPPATTLRSPIENRLVAMIKGAARLHSFEQLHPEPPDVFSPDRKLVSLGVSSFAAGDVYRSRAGVDCYDLSTDQDALLFELRSEPVYKFEWLYDRATLAPRRVVFVDLMDMRADLALVAAAHLRSPESIPFVRPFLKHPNHLIRWSAVKALIHLEPGEAAAYLEALEQDCHPQLREAAHRLRAEIESVRT